MIYLFLAAGMFIQVAWIPPPHPPGGQKGGGVSTPVLVTFLKSQDSSQSMRGCISNCIQPSAELAHSNIQALLPGLKDGESIPEEAKPLLVAIVSAAFLEDDESAEQLTQQAVSDQARAERRNMHQ